MKPFEKPPIEKYVTVPVDMIMDILHVLVSHAIQFEIKSVDVNENSILLYLSPRNQNAHYSKALENLEVMLSEYREYANLLLS